METLRHLERIEVRGTSAERLALKTTDLPTDKLFFFYESDTKNKWLWIGDWVLVESGGAALVVDGALASGPIYDNGTYKYFGEAVPGTALAAAFWRVSRMEIATGRIQWADGNADFDNVFTNLTTVAALTYV